MRFLECRFIKLKYCCIKDAREQLGTLPLYALKMRLSDPSLKFRPPYRLEEAFPTL